MFNSWCFSSLWECSPHEKCSTVKKEKALEAVQQWVMVTKHLHHHPQWMWGGCDMSQRWELLAVSKCWTPHGWLIHNPSCLTITHQQSFSTRECILCAKKDFLHSKHQFNQCNEMCWAFRHKPRFYRFNQNRQKVTCSCLLHFVHLKWKCFWQQHTSKQGLQHWTRPK